MTHKDYLLYDLCVAAPAMLSEVEACVKPTPNCLQTQEYTKVIHKGEEVDTPMSEPGALCAILCEPLWLKIFEITYSSRLETT